MCVFIVFVLFSDTGSPIYSVSWGCRDSPRVAFVFHFFCIASFPTWHFELLIICYNMTTEHRPARLTPKDLFGGFISTHGALCMQEPSHCSTILWHLSCGHYSYSFVRLRYILWTRAFFLFEITIHKIFITTHLSEVVCVVGLLSPPPQDKWSNKHHWGHWGSTSPPGSSREFGLRPPLGMRKNCDCTRLC